MDLVQIYVQIFKLMQNWHIQQKQQVFAFQSFQISICVQVFPFSIYQCENYVWWLQSLSWCFMKSTPFKKLSKQPSHCKFLCLENGLEIVLNIFLSNNIDNSNYYHKYRVNWYAVVTFVLDQQFHKPFYCLWINLTVNHYRDFIKLFKK